jgi:hypothetical protein
VFFSTCKSLISDANLCTTSSNETSHAGFETLCVLLCYILKLHFIISQLNELLSKRPQNYKQVTDVLLHLRNISMDESVSLYR